MIKRLFDLFVAITLLIILFPLLIVVSILVRVKLGSPIFFRQQRPGLNGKLFSVVKYRTMTDEKDSDGQFLSDAVRLTPFGKFLRSTSIDELPELINIIKGEMSLVGPRPLLKQYLERYSDEQRRRLDVRPGITGWAQINGRNTISWEEKFKLDVWYVDNHSFLLDFKILLLTAWKTVKRADINAPGEATMSEFMGSKE